MKVVDIESTIFIDVDDTLVLWNGVKRRKAGYVNIRNPYDKSRNWVKPHKGHIKILKDRHHRGSFIVVWSAGGYAWAKAVVKRLKLEKYVDLIMTKPHAYIDDKTSNEFMGEHIYLGRNSKYGL